MPVISCLNAKGGTGKTTSAINLAAVAAYRGYTVHVLDADAEQGTASEWIEYANDAFEEDPNAPHVDVEVEAVNRGILARKVKNTATTLSSSTAHPAITACLNSSSKTQTSSSFPPPAPTRIWHKPGKSSTSFQKANTTPYCPPSGTSAKALPTAPGKSLKTKESQSFGPA